MEMTYRGKVETLLDLEQLVDKLRESGFKDNDVINPASKTLRSETEVSGRVQPKSTVRIGKMGEKIAQVQDNQRRAESGVVIWMTRES